MATFPLRMVTVGAAGVLGLTLWVIADQRFESRNYATQTIEQGALVWDFADGSHNYAEVFDEQIDAAGGRAWINEHTDSLYSLGLSSAEEVEIATVGLSSPTVTRLRTRMLVDHLGEDLELQPAEDPSHVSNFIQVEVGINEPDLECYDYPPRDCPAPNPVTMWGDRENGGLDFGCAAAAGGLSPRSGALIVALGVGLAFVLRRRRQ
jgi:MYXO-CTERM domain-containing protein